MVRGSHQGESRSTSSHVQTGGGQEYLMKSERETWCKGQH